MSFTKQKNCLYLIKFIITYNYTSFSIYKHCSAPLTVYIVITNSLKYFKYIYYSHSCISVSLESLNCIYF